jgi:hypothetical protein
MDVSRREMPLGQRRGNPVDCGLWSHTFTFARPEIVLEQSELEPNLDLDHSFKPQRSD